MTKSFPGPAGSHGPSWGRSVWAGLLCLGIIVVFQSPRWWLIVHETPGTFEWDRALSYLRQCAAPLRTDIEAAMRWRFLPQAIVYLLGDSRALALAFPWLGAWAFLAYLYHQGATETGSRRIGWELALLLGCSAPIFVSTGWLGVNDAWIFLGLCYLSFGRRRWLHVLCCLACPLIDERFVFGLPLAFYVRAIARSETGTFGTCVTYLLRTVSLAVLPFLLTRLLFAHARGGGDADRAFLLSSIRTAHVYLWMAPMALWMAWRMAFVPAAEVFVRLTKDRPALGALGGAAALLPVMVGFLLASDTMRTAAVLAPFVVWSAVQWGKDPDKARFLRWLAAANLILPAAQVSYTTIVPINSLPVELWHLLHH